MNKTYIGKEPDTKTLEVLQGFAQHEAMLRDGHQLFVSVMNWMMIDCHHKALELIGQGNNCHKIACAMTSFFHGADECDLRVRKARGYDQLRKLVKVIVVIMQEEYSGEWPSNYKRLVNRLFTSRGLPEPCYQV